LDKILKSLETFRNNRRLIVQQVAREHAASCKRTVYDVCLFRTTSVLVQNDGSRVGLLFYVVLTRSVIHRSHEARAARGSAVARSTPRVPSVIASRAQPGGQVTEWARRDAARSFWSCGCRRPSDGLTCLTGFPTGSMNGLLRTPLSRVTVTHTRRARRINEVKRDGSPQPFSV
jgi:hypothetical protein